MSEVISVLLALAIVPSVTALLLLAVAIRRPDLRIWPPWRVGSLQWVTVWSLLAVALVGIILVGVNHWNAWGLPAWVRWGVGGSLVVLGNAVAWWGVTAIGMRNATGAMEGGLARHGLYRYTRNPQYLGDVTLLVGWVVLASSFQVAVAVAPGILAFLLTPIPEEHALRKKFGEEYARYLREVPRFF